MEHLSEIHTPYQYSLKLLTAGWHGLDPNMPMGTLLSKVKDTEAVPLGAPFNWFGPASTGFARRTLNREHEELYHYCAVKQPAYLLCGPEPLLGLARYAIASGRRAFSPRLALSLGSTVTDDIREIVTEGLGAKIVDRYSAEEVGTIAIQCPRHEHLHVLGLGSIMEIVDDTGRPCAIGQPGRVLVTNLNSFAMPLIRYELGDIAEWGGACDFGITLPTVKRIWGRTARIFSNPDGRKTYGKIYARVFRDIPDLMEYRFVLHQRVTIDAQLKVTIQSEALKNAVIERVQEALGYPYPVRVRYVSKVDWGASWKQESFELSDAPLPD